MDGTRHRLKPTPWKERKTLKGFYELEPSVLTDGDWTEIYRVRQMTNFDFIPMIGVSHGDAALERLLTEAIPRDNRESNGFHAAFNRETTGSSPSTLH